MTKLPTKAECSRKHLLSLWFQGYLVHDGTVESLHLHLQVGGRERTQGTAWTFETSSLHLVTDLPNKATSPNPFQVVPPAGDQIFQHEHRGAFSFKPPVCHSLLPVDNFTICSKLSGQVLAIMGLLLVLKILQLLLGLLCSLSEGLITDLYIHISMAVRNSSLEVILDVITQSLLENRLGYV